MLNDCATKNLESLGSIAPEFAELQKKAGRRAVEAASRQTTAVVNMKKRMASLEAETRRAVVWPMPAAAAPVAPLRRCARIRGGRRGRPDGGAGGRGHCRPGIARGGDEDGQGTFGGSSRRMPAARTA
ncbi:MAG: hypothetical protein U1E17_01460 [Geminicoccaceae bacterium]